jgi:hypothetical protein
VDIRVSRCPGGGRGKILMSPPLDGRANSGPLLLCCLGVVEHSVPLWAQCAMAEAPRCETEDGEGFRDALEARELESAKNSPELLAEHAAVTKVGPRRPERVSPGRSVWGARRCGHRLLQC